MECDDEAKSKVPDTAIHDATNREAIMPDESVSDAVSHDAAADDPTLQLPDILQHIVGQPWFPKASLVDGFTAENIFDEIIAIMSSCAPATYGKICDDLLALVS